MFIFKLYNFSLVLHFSLLPLLIFINEKGCTRASLCHTLLVQNFEMFLISLHFTYSQIRFIIKASLACYLTYEKICFTIFSYIL